MFVIKKVESYFWPVKVELPKDGGSYQKHEFQAHFKRITQSQLKILLEGEGDKNPTDKEFCKSVVIGWKDILDEEKNPIEFSDESLETLIEIPSVAKTIVVSYLDSIAGSKVKN